MLNKNKKNVMEKRKLLRDVSKHFSPFRGVNRSNKLDVFGILNCGLSCGLIELRAHKNELDCDVSPELLELRRRRS